MLIRADGPHPPCQALSSALLAEAPALPSSGHLHAERGCSHASRQHPLPLRPGCEGLPSTHSHLPAHPFRGLVRAEDQASRRR